MSAMEERARHRRNELRKEQNREQKRRKRRQILRLQLLGICVLFAIAFYTVYDRVLDRDTMGCRISIYGERVSHLTPQEAQEKLTKSFLDTQILFIENGKEIYQTTVGNAGYSLDPNELQKELLQIQNDRKPCWGLVEFPKNKEIHCRILEDTAKQKAAFSAEHLQNVIERRDSENAKIVYDKKDGQYHIQEAVLGTKINEVNLLKKTQEVLKESFEKDLFVSKIRVTVDEEVYQEPEITEEEPELLAKKEEKNRRLISYPMASLTYTFGTVKEELTSEQIQEWVVQTEEDIYLDEMSVRQYVKELADTYDTKRADRMFQTSYGYEVGMWQNEYGYKIDQDAEYRQLCKDLESGMAIEREPVYAQRGYNRDGMDDLMGNYLEVSLDAQYLWLYQNGEVITETPVVTGKPTGLNTKTGEMEDWSTLRGAFEIAYKQSPSTLSSEIYGYETEVQYWMPFEDGQGFHDAQWQTSFGGTVYQYAGSHGCVNLPLDHAAVIYRYIEEGYPVIIY